MQRTLECDICSHLYDTRTRLPKNLLCGHSFCLVCLDGMIRDVAITCPRCRSRCEVPNKKVSTLPTNYTILELFDTVCAECKDQPHTQRCQHCSLYLCDDCRRKHVPGNFSESSYDEMIADLKQLQNESQQTAEKIRSQGQAVMNDIKKAHEAKLKRLEDAYQRQIAEVGSKVTGELELQQAWGASINNIIDDTVAKKNNQYHSKVKEDINNIKRSRPVFTNIWYDDMADDFQILIGNCGKVNMSIKSMISNERSICQKNVTDAKAAPDYTKAKFMNMVGTRGADPAQFKNPRGVLVGNLGEIIVADWLNDRLQVFDADLNVVRLVSTDGGFDLCKVGDYIFVTQSSKRQIAVFTNRFEPLTTIGADQVSFNDPRGIASDKDGRLYVCDNGDRCIKILKPSGEFIKQFGEEAFPDVGPRYIAVSRDKVYVSDNNYNLLTFSRNRHQLLSTLKACTPPTNVRVTGIAVDAEDNLVLSDSMGRLVVMRDGGRLVTVVGTHGRGPGQLRGPEGVALGRGGELVVCDGGNDRVVIFTVPNV